MRLLLLPMVWSGSMHSDADYLCYHDLIVHSAEQDRPVFFYLVLPHRYRHEAKELPRTKIFFYHSDRVRKRAKTFAHEVTWFPDMLHPLFNRRFGMYPVDGIIITRTSATLPLHALVSDNLDLRHCANLFVILWEAMYRDYGKQSPDDMALRAAAYACADKVLLLCPSEREKVDALARKFLSPSLQHQVDDRCVVQGIGVNTVSLDAVMARNQKRDRLTVFYGARYSEEKRTGFLLDVVSGLKSSGLDFDFLSTTGSSQDVVSLYLKRFTHQVEMYADCQRDKYWDIMSQAHIFLCASRLESFPVGFWEQLYTLQVGVIPDEPWARGIFPSRWPFWFDSKRELVQLLRWIIENYDEALQRVSWVRSWIKEHADVSLNNDYILDTCGDLFTKQVGEGITSKESSILGQILDRIFMNVGDRISWANLLGSVESNVIFFRANGDISPPSGGARYILSFFDVYLYALSHGFRDQCETPYPVFERV